MVIFSQSTTKWANKQKLISLQILIWPQNSFHGYCKAFSLSLFYFLNTPNKVNPFRIMNRRKLKRRLRIQCHERIDRLQYRENRVGRDPHES